MSTRVAADLHFEMSLPGRPAIHGHITGSDNRLTLHIDDPGAFAGNRDVAAIKAMATRLHRMGIVLRVEHEGKHLVSFGAIRSTMVSRRYTGSRHIRLGSVRGTWTSTRARATFRTQRLPEATFEPPGTPWPLVPTMMRRPRRAASTTHDPARGGEARLVAVKQEVRLGERVPVLWLTAERTTIGSDPSCDVVLPGLAPHHATVIHDEADEYVVCREDGSVKVHGAPVERSVLRTGSRVEIGTHCLAFFREEFADHGRPYGGRIGGELGHQKPQPPREVMQRVAAATA